MQLKCADLEILQHERVDSDAETADEGEPTEVVQSDASTDDGATTPRQGELLKVHKGGQCDHHSIMRYSSESIQWISLSEL